MNKIIPASEFSAACGEVARIAVAAYKRDCSPMITVSVKDTDIDVTINVRDDATGNHCGFNIHKPFTREQLAADLRHLADRLSCKSQARKMTKSNKTLSDMAEDERRWLFIPWDAEKGQRPPYEIGETYTEYLHRLAKP